MSFNILVLTSDRSTGANFAKSLQLSKTANDKFSVIGTTTHPARAHLTANDYTVLLPPEIEKDPVAIRDHVETVLNMPINLVYETRSADKMLRLSRNRDKLPVFLPDQEAVETFENKFKTFEHLESHGFPVPKTRQLNARQDVRVAMHEIGSDEFWLRAAFGQGGEGSFVSNNEEEIIETLNQENGWGKYTIAEKLPVDSNLSWQERLSDEIHAGEMVNWLALYDNGSLVASQTRKRLYFEHGELSKSGVGYTGGVMSLQRDDIHELSEAMIKSFGFTPHGPIGIDFVADRNGKPKLTEVQACRFYTTTYFLSMMGLNFPRMLIDTFQGKTPNLEIKINPVQAGMVWMQRFGADDTLRHRDEILSLIESGYMTNDPSSVMHRNITPTTKKYIQNTAVGSSSKPPSP